MIYAAIKSLERVFIDISVYFHGRLPTIPNNKRKTNTTTTTTTTTTNNNNNESEGPILRDSFLYKVTGEFCYCSPKRLDLQQIKLNLNNNNNKEEDKSNNNNNNNNQKKKESSHEKEHLIIVTEHLWFLLVKMYPFLGAYTPFFISVANSFDLDPNTASVIRDLKKRGYRIYLFRYLSNSRE